MRIKSSNQYKPAETKYHDTTVLSQLLVSIVNTSIEWLCRGLYQIHRQKEDIDATRVLSSYLAFECLDNDENVLEVTNLTTMGGSRVHLCEQRNRIHISFKWVFCPFVNTITLSSTHIFCSKLSMRSVPRQNTYC